MMIKIFRQFSSGHVICLLANSQKADRIGADLIKNLKTISNNEIKFIGSGGPFMQEQGLEAFYSTDLFHSKPFVPFRGTDPTEGNVWLWWKRNPITRSLARPLHEVLNIAKKTNLVEKIQGSRPGVILTLDHDVLSFKLHKQISNAYKLSGGPRPKQAHYGRFINRYEPYQLDYLDHAFYTIPIEPYN